MKFDGYRMQLRVAGGAARLRTRKGLDWTERFQALADAAAGLPDCILDGEAVALDGDDKLSFAALQAALSDGRSDELIYYAFDLLFEDGEDLRDLPLSERKARLKTLLDGRDDAIRYVEHFETSGEAVWRSAQRLDLEGIVSKRLAAPYRSGRSDAWSKAKLRPGDEVVIGGWTGQKGRLRSLLVGRYQDGALVYAGRVGTGFSSAVVSRLLPRLEAVASADSPFSGPGATRNRRARTPAIPMEF